MFLTIHKTSIKKKKFKSIGLQYDSKNKALTQVKKMYLAKIIHESHLVVPASRVSEF